MGVPFEALIPYGIVVVMFGVTGAGLSVVKTFANDGKKARWNRDLWDRRYNSQLLHYRGAITNNQSCEVMERDLRLTGSLRGQSTNPEAPKGFEINNPWKVEKRMF
ncbi:hypothetical protein ASPSYDRAFT_43815 [Aspergillus sydowii CBS 593.65]|uniref:NADH dehydrogenase [ubiquinone] 1 alpha subcomplex subunit 1 n=1 Tax=Aspergillus sydowii CBS 593.65 TaxID=1036612 RepID=A0A1L9TJ48_9EURO|nr:uncharacterized protein ASPSYDRAFT_43815 [Aspergillus sydowii CBS 593.65]OJJ59464.1 hypothetical protein ASPSYDRAFT_43815 [Aspergillus sydowii CBS 593.65]